MKKKFTFSELNKIIKQKDIIIFADIGENDFCIVKSFVQKSQEKVISCGDLDKEGVPYCGIYAKIGFNEIPYEELNGILIAQRVQLKIA